MHSFVVILSCLAAVALALPTEDVIVGFNSRGRATCRKNCNRANPLNNCPPTNCPPPVRDGFCGEVDCSIPGNRVVLHPTLDPNYFYQCAPYDAIGTWRPIRRPCACETIFSTRYNRCVHLAEWEKDCPGQPDKPVFKECIEDCLSCDEGVGEPGPDSTPGPITTPKPDPETPGPDPDTPGPITTPRPDPDTPGPITTPGPDNCQCPCAPCVWWPCMPCMPVCRCNNQSPQQPQQPQQPWERPVYAAA